MLLLHQAGSVKIGEVVRYTLTYTPAHDRILPTPPHLHVKIKNTSAIPLRAAWVHGPYGLHVATYPASFNPHQRTDSEDGGAGGAPEYEPMLKAGGSWRAKLHVPDAIRESGADLGKRRPSRDGEKGDDAAAAAAASTGRMTWVIEVASQILFSTSAAVHFEVLVGRDERSLDLGFAAVAGHGHGGPGQVQAPGSERERKRARRNGNVQTAGVYSKAVRLVVENTEALWDKPPLPSRTDEAAAAELRKSTDSRRKSEDGEKREEETRGKKRKKLHLVILTHGLHSNVGADMLFLKESIDATVAQARLDARKRKQEARKRNAGPQPSVDAGAAEGVESGTEQDKKDTSTAPLSGGQEDLNSTEAESDDEEDTIVRGFNGNAVRTENGIQYLGKRLAKYILRFTYPDQPFLPVKKPLSRTLTDPFKSNKDKAKRDGMPSHAGSSIHHPSAADPGADLAYQFTSISFVGHSLGGLIQTYAIAYIHKHSPTFFTQIKPINFICMASPMLGLSNENPMYVKFALDFGLVGRTGRDLGLTWRPPNAVRGGWNAVIGGLGSAQSEHNKKHEGDPSAKPLLRILPTGPAHQVLRMFRNRTVYSNVVNDGIVPLRTSCLLFLDWRGLGKVDKARRENGLIGTVAEWGWAELTGQNLSSAADSVPMGRVESDDDDEDEHVRQGEGATVPQPDENETAEDNKRLTTRASYDESTAPEGATFEPKKDAPQEKGFLDNVLDFFRVSSPEGSGRPSSSHGRPNKTTKALRRGQTIYHGEEEGSDDPSSGQEGTTSNPVMRPHLPHLHSQQPQQKRPGATRGDSSYDPETGEVEAPPKTSIFESAGDILHPPLPSKRWITDPSSRPRAIFHDRVYHPEDIPAPPFKRHTSRMSLPFSSSTDSSRHGSSSSKVPSTPSSPSPSAPENTPDTSAMKVEEKIARAYHRDLSWRKVLVRLEPDAHNNMIVRRMFANAYGWPVIKHLCDTHFADTYAARTRTEDEPARDRVPLPVTSGPLPDTGEQVSEQTAREAVPRTQSETREARDELAGLNVSTHGANSTYSSVSSTLRGGRPTSVRSHSSAGSAMWDDSYFDEGSDDDDSDVDERNLVQRLLNPMPLKKPEPAVRKQKPSSVNVAVGVSSHQRTPSFTDGHRGLSPTTSLLKTPPSAKTTFDAASVEPIVAQRLVEEPEPMAGSTTADVGLGRRVDEMVGTPTKAGRSGGEADTQS